MTSAMKDYSEKRDFIRMKVNTEVVMKGDNGLVLKGLCIDLSGTGMLIETSESVPDNTELQTVLPSTNDKFPALNATVKVIRCTPKGDDKFEMGVSIVSVA